jgi:peptidoglycan/xylan/chitin deacetylase (PgdA/CDA1 family)
VDGVSQYGVDELVTLAAADHEIGCHTFTHARVSTLSAAALNKEIELNLAFAARYLPGLKLRTFAYPYGDVSFTATNRLQATFAGCRCSEPGHNVGTADLGRLRSERLYDRLVDAERVSALIDQAVSKTAWLIFYTHDVSATPSRFGCTPALFEHAVKSALAAGAEIRPVDSAIRVLGQAKQGDARILAT